MADEVSQRRAYEDAMTTVARIATDHGGITDIISTLALPREQMHQLLPRGSKALEAARAEVFVQALAVHQAFIAGSVGQFRRNLHLALRMVDGGFRPDEDTALDLWASLAIFVPVFSSTFASFSRCLPPCPRGVSAG